MPSCPFCPPPSERVICRGQFYTSLLSDPCIAYGHALVIPNRHIETLWQLQPWEILAIFREVIRLLKILHRFGFGAGSDVWIKYQPFVPNGKIRVSHLHVHIIPRSLDDRLFLAEQNDTSFRPLKPPDCKRLLGAYRSK